MIHETEKELTQLNNVIGPEGSFYLHAKKNFFALLASTV